MRLKIRHETIYEYDEPAKTAVQILRLTPRNSECQFVKRWRVEIDADARLDRGEDAFGNITHTVFVEGPLAALKVSVDGEVETADTIGVVRGTVERLPLALYLRETALTKPSAEIRAFAQAASDDEKADCLATLHAIMGHLHKAFTFATDTTTTTTTAAEAFAACKGVGQDFAQVFIAAARSIGIPARYVSGYFMRIETTEQEAAHAWAEAWIDGIGWIGFDCAHDLCVTDRFVRVASGLDYLDAAPIRGARTGGGAAEKLSVVVQVQQQRQLMIEG